MDAEGIEPSEWRPGMPVPDGYCIQINEDGSEEPIESWSTSPCSEPVEDDEDGGEMEIIICLGASDGPSTGTPVYPEDRPDLHDEPVWGLYEVRADDEGEWDYTTITYDVTLAGATAVADEWYPGVRVLG